MLKNKSKAREKSRIYIFVVLTEMNNSSRKKCRLLTTSVIFLPEHPASFAHNFVSRMQSFCFQRVRGCYGIADLS